MVSRDCLNWVMSALAPLFFCAAVGVAQAAEPPYPTRPIRLLVNSAPGGALDALARIVSPKLSDSMGQTWVVDNRGGAAGNLGAELVARANPDGHTVLMTNTNLLTVHPSLYKLPFSVEKDLQPITILSMAEQILVVHPGVQANTLKELVALARQKPGALNFASAGVGSSTHLGAELLKKRTGLDVTHVPYKGGGAAAAAVLAGESQMLVGTVASTHAFITARRLRALATTGAQRSKLTPELPTVAESGYPGFDASSVNILLAPGATPNRIVERIRNAALNALQHADVQTAMARLGMEPMTATPAELAARIKRETRMWADVIKEAGIRAE